MKKLLLALALLLAPSSAFAQCTGIFAPNTFCGNNTGTSQPPFQVPASSNISGPGTTTVNDLALWNNASGSLLKDQAPGALSVANDINVTITSSGSTSIALVNPATLTMGWAGTLAAGRLNSNVVQGVTNDTNVTGSIAAQNLTLGWTGTLAAARLNSNVVQAFTNDTNVTASIAAQNATLGWTGTLAVARGGTGAGTQSGAVNNLLPTPVNPGDILYWNGSAWVTIAGNSSGTQVLSENASGTPAWLTVTGTGSVTSVTPGGGLVSSVTAACSQSAITTSGTLSKAECVNAQSGASYAILDGDRGKLITATNAGAMAYTIAQATGTSFQAGWHADIRNISTIGASTATNNGVITLTPTVSTINGLSSIKIYPGVSGRLVSDGANYQFIFSTPPGAWTLLNTLTASTSASLQDTTSITSQFTEYEIVIESLLPATNNITLRLQVQVSGTFQGASYVNSVNNANGSANGTTADTGGIDLGPLNLIPNTGNGVYARILLSNPAQASSAKTLHGDYGVLSGSAFFTGTTAGAYTGSSVAVTGIQLIASSGNLASGVMKIYGRT